MSELLFECYSVPAVCYGVDAMFSLYANHSASITSSSSPSIAIPPTSFTSPNYLVINSSNSSTHVFPVINNQWVPNKCKRYTYIFSFPSLSSFAFFSFRSFFSFSLLLKIE